MGFCFPFNLEISEWIIGSGFLALIVVAIWKDKDEKKWQTYKIELEKNKKVNGREQKRTSFNKWLHYIQKTLNYFFGFIIRQFFFFQCDINGNRY